MNPLNPGEWYGEEPPTRREALILAAQCASAAGDVCTSRETGAVRIAQAQAWVAIAAVADANDGTEPTFLATQRADGVPMRRCGHRRAIARFGTGDRWLHIDVPHLSVCDKPAGPAPSGAMA